MSAPCGCGCERVQLSSTCGCCEGVQRLTPRTLTNRPGLDALHYRVGTYATFLATMKAALSSAELEGIQRLTTRAMDDPSIALLEAWAVIADVLTFYQERIANEGYLRTATERRSILELARLVGYALRPGVAASVLLAYTLDPDSDVTIPAGSRAQSVPGPGELPQSFETAEPLEASAGWNNLRPRQTQPMMVTATTPVLYLAGITTGLKANDPLLLTGASEVLRHIHSVEPQPLENRTKVVLQPVEAADGETPVVSAEGAADDGEDSRGAKPAFEQLAEIIESLAKPPSQPPTSAARLDRSVASTFTTTGEIVPSLVQAFRPDLGSQLYTALGNAAVTKPSPVKVFALRATAAPFGHNAPLKPIPDERGVPVGYEEWPLAGSVTTEVTLTARFQPPGLTMVAIELPDQFHAVVTVKEGASAEAAAATLTQAETTLTLTNERVTIRRDDRDFLFAFKRLRRRIHIAIEHTQVTITVDDDEPRVVQPGQTISYVAAGHRVSIRIVNAVIVSVDAPGDPDRHVLPLNATYDQIVPQSWVVVSRAADKAEESLIARVKKAVRITKTDYGLTAPVTQLTLDKPWLKDTDLLLSAARGVTVYAQSEKLTLAEEPILEPVCGGQVELDALYSRLESGRWLIVSGERTDVPGTSGIKAAEVVMLAGVEQDVQVATSEVPGIEGPPEVQTAERSGDRTHSFLRLAADLAYCYKRDTVTIHGNVTRATHGESRSEMLGHGDGTRPFQSFSLRQPPLTHVAAPTPAGAQSTLEVRVNDVRWHEADSLARLGPTDRRFVTRADDDDHTIVTFGNGERGARLPTGIENVRAAYRTGIGKPGNLQPDRITLLTTRPLGVKAVTNPLRASGGADREDRDQGRRNAPLGVMALDRLVATKDYEHFARTFAGIGKASATPLPRAGRRTVHLTIAGSDDIAIDVSSDLYRNLVTALHRFGDPHVPVQVVTRELKLLVLEATVGFAADYEWEIVERQVREALLRDFGFDRRELGQDVRLSEIVSVIHRVPGVKYVDVDVMDAISELLIKDSKALAEQMARLVAAGQTARPAQRVRAERTAPGRPLPAQLVVFSPDVPDTLILHGTPS